MRHRPKHAAPNRAQVTLGRPATVAAVAAAASMPMLPTAAHAAAASEPAHSTATVHPGPATARHPGAVITTAARHHFPGHYVVRNGDTLSKIARHVYGSAKLWPALWWVNRHHIPNPNMITAGQRLRLSGWHPDPPRWLEHAALGAIPAAPASGYVGRHRNEATYASAPAASPATVSLGGYSGFQQCVITRESGGNAQVMNSTGHYGLYQFSYSTWVAYGGSGADFGHASVAEQNQVFSNAMATPGGANNWAPYDGC